MKQVAVDEPSSSTPTDSEWNPGCQGVLHNPALNNLTPVINKKLVIIILSCLIIVFFIGRFMLVKR